MGLGFRVRNKVKVRVCVRVRIGVRVTSQPVNCGASWWGWPGGWR